MFEVLIQHQLWTAVVLSWIFSAAVSAMPEPDGNGSPAYLWFYRFLHSVAGNITTAFSEAARFRAGASRGNKIPGPKTIALLTLIAAVLITTALLVHRRLAAQSTGGAAAS